MDSRGINLVAALVTALDDGIQGAVTQVAGIAGAAPAALTVLLSDPGIGVDGLAQALPITGSGAVRLLDRLVGAGLVERRRGKDSRSVALWLSPAGTEAARDVLRRRHGVIADALLGISDEDQRVLVRISEGVLARLTTGRESAERICRLCDCAVCPQERCPVEQGVS